MRKLPQIPNNVISDALYYWVSYGMEGFDVIGVDGVKLLSNWYKSLNTKKLNSSVLYYRGLMISDSGFSKFSASGKLKLKKKPAESWTCRRDVAYRFSEESVFHNTSNSSIMLGMKMQEKNVLFNLSNLPEIYKNVDLSDASKNFLDALKMIESYDECELVTNTTCTSCSIGTDIISISFKYNKIKSYDNLEILFNDHLDLKKWFWDNENDMQEYNKLISINFDGRKWLAEIK